MQFFIINYMKNTHIQIYQGESIEIKILLSCSNLYMFPNGRSVLEK